MRKSDCKAILPAEFSAREPYDDFTNFSRNNQFFFVRFFKFFAVTGLAARLSSPYKTTAAVLFAPAAAAIMVYDPLLRNKGIYFDSPGSPRCLRSTSMLAGPTSRNALYASIFVMPFAISSSMISRHWKWLYVYGISNPGSEIAQS